MRAFLQQWLGLSLTGDVSEQKLAFFYGKGGNGKSVLIDAVSYVAGDYGETVPIETFLDQGKARSAGQATPDLSRCCRPCGCCAPQSLRRIRGSRRP
jgi:putative DNA primase/helicase